MSRLLVGCLLSLLTTASFVSAQEAPSPRSLFEAGRFQEVVDIVRARAEAASPSDIYIAAQSLTRLERNDEARDLYDSLDSGDDENPWDYISRSAVAVLDGNSESGLSEARQAVEKGPDHFYAHYELGLVQTLRGDFSAAAATFERATQIDASDAYAHYYAGLAYNKIRRADRMARHFQAFVQLAPDAPERAQVEALLRTLRF